MVSVASAVPHIVVVGSDCPIGNAVASQYEQSGARVSRVDISDVLPDKLRFSTDVPVDIAVFADDFSGPAKRAVETSRSDFAAGFSRLTYAPFRLANLIRPHLAPGGRMVLVTRSNVGMTVPDDEGRYLERPFRAAAHALWRCMSVEWLTDGAACGIVAIDDAADAAALPGLVDGLRPVAGGCVMLDRAGNVLPW